MSCVRAGSSQTLSGLGKTLGTYYFYINKTRQDWFCIDPIDLDIKAYALGHNFGSRVFSLLLLNNAPDYTGFEQHELIGQWIGDEVFITGDEFDDWFHQNRNEMTDISDRILAMVSIVAPGDFLTYGGDAWFKYFVNESGRMTNEVRKRLLVHYRGERNFSQSTSIDEIISSLRPKEQ